MNISDKGRINFLDLIISDFNTKDELANFCKPSRIEIIIMNYSYHPYQHEYSAASSLIHSLNKFLHQQHTSTEKSK